VRPLKHYLQNQRDENAIRLGLFKIAGTLKFLNQDSKIIHGNINENSVFVTKSGEWKLGGFELASPIGDQHLINFGSLLQGRFIPPESEPSNNANG
jgi:SCY1-like protein 1